MPLWFTHLRHALETSRAIPRPWDHDAFVWGVLCPDVDKLGAVPRETSHLGGKGLALAPDRFLAALGAGTAEVTANLDFLCGYLSHLAVDDAWYRGLFQLRRSDPSLAEGWTGDTTRAVTLLWDLEIRRHMVLAPVNLDLVRGEGLLAFYTPELARRVRRAARAWMGWSGDLEAKAPGDLQAWGESFRHLLRVEGGRGEAILARIDGPATMAALDGASTDRVRALLDWTGGTRHRGPMDSSESR